MKLPNFNAQLILNSSLNGQYKSRIFVSPIIESSVILLQGCGTLREFSGACESNCKCKYFDAGGNWYWECCDRYCCPND